MRKVKYISFFVFILTMAIAGPASASITMEELYSTAVIFNVVLLICALICLMWSLKIMSLVRGGLMSKSWQMFVLGFGFLVVAQMLVIGENAKLLVLPGYIITMLYLLMALMWLVGLYRTRKVLG